MPGLCGRMRWKYPSTDNSSDDASRTRPGGRLLSPNREGAGRATVRLTP